MDLVSAFRVFVRVTETGSFSAVARESGISQPAVSRQVAALETRIGTRLFHRTTRHLVLTDDGRDLLEHARHVLDALGEAEQALDRRHSGVAGLVRIAVPAAFGRIRVAPSIAKLLNAHPELEIDLLLGDSVQDLVAEGIDIAVRAGPIADSSLIARRLGAIDRFAFASASYLQRRGEPGHPRDLIEHDCILLANGSSHSIWHFDGPDGTIDTRVHGRLRCNSTDAIREAVLNGHGIGMLPDLYFVDELATGLVRAVPAGWREPILPVHLVYPSRRHLPARVRAVISFLVAEFGDDTGPANKKHNSDTLVSDPP